MTVLTRIKSTYASLRERVYELLEIAAPGDTFSRIINLSIICLVLINGIAFVLEFWTFFAPYERYFNYIELYSLLLFCTEYLLRLWSCTSAPTYRHPIAGRLRFALRPVILVDLIAILPFLLPFFFLLDLRILRLLRLFRLVRLFKLARFLREQPANETAITELLNDYQRELARIRSQLAQGRERDLTQLREQIEQVVNQVRLGQRALFAHRRKKEQINLDRETLLTPLDEVEANLDTEDWQTETRTLTTTAYMEAAALFDQAPEWASVSIDIGWKSIQGFNRVPIRSIGQYHFHNLIERDAAAHARFHRAYVSETERRLDAVRAAMSFALDQVEQKKTTGLSKDVRLSFNRSLNRLRDLGDPARSAWDGLLWELEDDQQQRIELIRVDVSRYGSLMFYLGRFGRWFKHHLNILTSLSISLIHQLIPDVRQWVKDSYTEILEKLRPLLQWLGLTKAQTQEVLKTVDQVQLMQQRDLPDDYLQHFDLIPLDSETLFIGFDEELEIIDQAIQRWEDRLPSSFLLYGQRGAGKTTLINVAQMRLFDEEQWVIRAVVGHKITTVEDLVAYLSKLLELEEIDDFEALASSLLEGPRCAIILEGCHNLFLRRIGGLNAIRHLLWLVARTNHHVLWCLCMDEHAYGFLSKSQPINQLFHYEIGIQKWEPDELRQLVLLRHNQSGYSLNFDLNKDLEKTLRRRIRGWRRSEEPVVQEALEQIFFEQLAETCGENVLVALQYWLSALEPVGQDRYRVQPMRGLDLALVNDASLDQAFILTAILQHDNLTAREMAKILDTNLIQTRLELEILDNLNILDFDLDSGRYRVNPIVLEPIKEMLEGRNLLY